MGNSCHFKQSHWFIYSAAWKGSPARGKTHGVFLQASAFFYEIIIPSTLLLLPVGALFSLLPPGEIMRKQKCYNLIQSGIILPITKTI